jgi:hypothetical protein
VGADAGTQLSVSTPNTVFVLFDGVGEMYCPGHRGWPPRGSFTS